MKTIRNHNKMKTIRTIRNHNRMKAIRKHNKMKAIRKHSETILQALSILILAAIIITWFANIEGESIEDLKSREKMTREHAEWKASLTPEQREIWKLY